MSETARTVEMRITDYLCGGGLFNPELANHDAVRDLLIDARDALAAERERADRSKAEGIKEGLRMAAAIAYGLAIRSDKVSTATTVRAAILKEAGE